MPYQSTEASRFVEQFRRALSSTDEGKGCPAVERAKPPELSRRKSVRFEIFLIARWRTKMVIDRILN
jgi:hypothetical protein